MVPIKLDGVRIYGVVAGDETRVRVRVSADEAEQLGLSPGRRLRVEAPGRAGAFLLTAAEEHPPFVFLRLSPLATRAAG